MPAAKRTDQLCLFSAGEDYRAPREMNLRALGGKTPHQSWGKLESERGAGFLEKHEVKDTRGGVRLYSSSNCHYVLFPSGLVVERFGYHGRLLFEEATADPERCQNRVENAYHQKRRLLEEICSTYEEICGILRWRVRFLKEHSPERKSYFLNAFLQ